MQSNSPIQTRHATGSGAPTFSLETPRVGASIVIPVYNEVGAVEETLRQVHEHLTAADMVFEIVAVDDGSRDGTAQVLAGIDLPHLVKVVHPVNRGYGAALKTGIKNARFDTVVITDADGTYPNERMAEFIQDYRQSGSDMIVGARTGGKRQNPSRPQACQKGAQ